MISASPYTCLNCKKPTPSGVSFCPHCGFSQQSGTGELWMGDRRLVTVLFADLASFTATSEKADPEDVIDMLNQAFSRLAVEYDREGGYLDKTVGDQLMVLFGAPRAHEDDPVRAVRAALGMKAAIDELAPMMKEKVGRAIKLNIGINTGIVVWGRMGPPGRMASTVIGDDVNLASRLEHYATDGQIIVSDSVYSLTRRYFEYDVLQPIRVKGKSEPIPIYMPLGPRRAFYTGKGVSSERMSPLVERERELQILHAHWSFATMGQSRVVLLTGEPGMGKTRILSEFLEQLYQYKFPKTPIMLHSIGGSGTSAIHSPIKEILTGLFDFKTDDTDIMRRRKVEDRAQILGISDRRFLPLMGYLLNWYQDDERLTETQNQLRASAVEMAADLVLRQATSRPLMITIDNLQWADKNSLEWLKTLSLAKNRHPDKAYDLMVLALTRPEIETPLDEFAADDIVTIEPLSPLAQRDLISSLIPGGDLPASLLERLVRESGGNPFYLEEAARGLIQSEQLVRQDGKWHLTRSIDQVYIPHSIEGQVMAHLDILDESSRMALQHASVIGMTFKRQLLTAITPISNIDAALENLAQRALITRTTGDNETDPGYTFAQMIVREVAYRSLLRKTRRELHDKITTLTDEGRDTVNFDFDVESVEALARHYMAGGNEEKIAIYNWLVGLRAMDRFNFEDACTHLEIAHNALLEIETPDRETHLNVLYLLGDASTFTGKFTQAATCYQAVWEMVKHDPKELVTLYYRIGRLNAYQGNIESAHTSYQYAEQLAQDQPELLAQLDAEIRLLYDWS